MKQRAGAGPGRCLLNQQIIRNPVQRVLSIRSNRHSLMVVFFASSQNHRLFMADESTAANGFALASATTEKSCTPSSERLFS